MTARDDKRERLIEAVRDFQAARRELPWNCSAMISAANELSEALSFYETSRSTTPQTRNVRCTRYECVRQDRCQIPAACHGQAFAWISAGEFERMKDRSIVYSAAAFNTLVAERDVPLFAVSAASATRCIDDLPLTCEAVGGVLDMRIGEKVLAFATENCPDLWDAEKDRGLYRVTDAAVFAKAVAHELNKESEGGSTPLSRLLDEVVEEAINQGAEGVEENNAADGGKQTT